MDPLNNALFILDQSLEKLEKEISKRTQKDSLYLAALSEKEKKITLLEEKKEKTLEELYQLREMIKKEIQLEVGQSIVKHKKSRPSSISMSDEE